MLKYILSSLLLLGALQAKSIKDLVTFKEAQQNYITGQGLVVGLEGSGDKKNPLRDRIVDAVLSNAQIDTSGINMISKNSAVVTLTGTLEPYMKKGQKINLVASTLFDAKSLKNGTLYYAQLTHAGTGRNIVYAEAQGTVNITEGQPETTGVVQGTVINNFPVTLINDQNKFTLVLRKPNAEDAARVTRQINQHFRREFKRDIAFEIDSGEIQVEVPEARRDKPVSFQAEIESIPVQITHEQAQVRINRRKGTVVFNKNVDIDPFVFSINDLTVKVGQQNQNQNQDVVTEFDKRNQPPEVDPQNPVQKTNLRQLVDALNLLGVKPKELATIIEEAHKVGALHAELIVE